MEIVYKESFIKDLARLKDTYAYNRVMELAFNVLPRVTSLSEIKAFKPLKGHKDMGRIRVGEYRIGLYIGSDAIELVRILSRKEIYRFFPR